MSEETKTAPSSSTATEQPDSHESTEKPEENARFECNICLDVAKDAVVSKCGHLFCWPCLHQWLETRPNQQLCPVCKSAISHDKVIPIYGRGGNESDPRTKVPPRPRGQRSEEPQSGFPTFHWGGDGGQGGVQFSLGIGVFPISFMASFFNANAGQRRNETPNDGSVQAGEEQLLSNVFFAIGIAFILWLLLL
ncbi:unnamed protein product [Bursaphelenchus xylophilus]|uniref:RING-type E3 ubiquitin transferase n=1 Tax=Bursaphelenchus xylophilus TaxID=6326 RepID=A0A1I7SQM9_BURXY|nr:unnamed protein product [Bursaphelenchus xylophilus]CAG9110127.1 unnamed protein product [Bursaphelenchus xylophilus]